MPSDLLKPPTPLVKVFSHDDAKGPACGLQLQKMVDRLVDERLRKVLPRFEEAMVQRVLGDRVQQEVESKLTCVELQLEAIYQEVAGLRSSCGCDASQEQEALRGRMQQVDALTSQWQGQLSSLQADLRGLRREKEPASRGAKAECAAVSGPAEDKATEQRVAAKAKSAEPRGGSKLVDQCLRSTSKCHSDKFSKMRQLLTEQFNERSEGRSRRGSAPDASQCITEKGEDSARKAPAPAARHGDRDGFAALVKEQLGDSRSRKDAGGEGQPQALCALNLERLSVCSTVTLFDSQSQSKDDGTLSQGSFSFFSESAP